MILYAPRMPADPVYSLRQSRSSTKLSRRLMSLLQGADPLEPKAPQGPHPPRLPRGPKGWGPMGGQRDPREWAKGDPRAPSAPLGGDGPMGPLGLFRSNSEWKVISSEGYYERKTFPKLKPFRKKAIRNESHSEQRNITPLNFSRRHPPRVLGLPGHSKRHPLKVLGLPGLFKRHPLRVLLHDILQGLF